MTGKQGTVLAHGAHGEAVGLREANGRVALVRELNFHRPTRVEVCGFDTTEDGEG